MWPKAIAALDLKSLKTIALDETASKRGRNYLAAFIGQDRPDKPAIYASPSKGMDCLKNLKKFCSFIKVHDGYSENIVEVVCNILLDFLSAIKQEFKSISVTVDWFHVARLFTKVVDDARKLEGRQAALPDHTRGVVLKRAEQERAQNQESALLGLIEHGFATAGPAVLKNFYAGLGGPNRSCRQVVHRPFSHA